MSFNNIQLDQTSINQAAAALQSDGERPLAPVGWHTFKIMDAEYTESASSNPMLVLELKIKADDETNGITVRDYIVNPEKLQWNKERLIQLCMSTIQVIPTDADDLIGQVVQARVKVKKARGEYGEGREIAAYKSASSEAKVMPAATPAPQPQPTPTPNPNANPFG